MDKLNFIKYNNIILDKLNFIKNNDIIVNIFNNIKPEYISYFNYLLIDTIDKNKLIELFNKIIKLKQDNKDIINNIDNNDITFIYDLITNDKYKNIIKILLDIPNKYNQINNITYYIKIFYMFISIFIIITYSLILYAYFNLYDNINDKLFNMITILSYIQLFNTFLIYKNIINVIIKFIIINLQYVPLSVYFFISSLVIGKLFIYYRKYIDNDIFNYKRYIIMFLCFLVILFNIISSSHYLYQLNSPNISIINTIFYLINQLFSDYYNLGNTFPNLPKTKIELNKF